MSIVSRIAGRVVGQCEACGAICTGVPREEEIEEGLFRTVIIIQQDGTEVEELRPRTRTVYDWTHTGGQ